eukprot:COSAG05_NODE_1017_length_6171_cov_45.912714_7_plen_131_part_00
MRGDKRHGLGVANLANGSRYEGEFKDNKCNGQGTCTYGNGRVESGQWKNMKFLGQARKQAGTTAATAAAATTAVDPVAAMHAKYPELTECAALVKLGLTATDTARYSCAFLLSFIYAHITYFVLNSCACT